MTDSLEVTGPAQRLTFEREPMPWEYPVPDHPSNRDSLVELALRLCKSGVQCPRRVLLQEPDSFVAQFVREVTRAEVVHSTRAVEKVAVESDETLRSAAVNTGN